MSYILDALQRADAERERGHVPGLHSQIVPSSSRKAARTRRWQPWHTAAVVAALLAFAGLWWWLGQEDGADPVAATLSTDVPPAAATPAVPPAAPAPTASLAAPRAATAPEPVLPILAPPRPEPARPAPSKTPASANAVAEPTAAIAPAPAAAATAPSAAAPVAPAPAPAATATPGPAAGPVRSFAELSPEARAQLPAVNVSGSTYSKNPALRMLIINGKVVQEGQEIAPGLKLETIGQRNAVLNHNGLRYSIGY
jgi:general secretion pathway protein B